ncbi:MAG: enoyl-CoA hydratase/isomerase family protein [Candidatus Brocadiae bacterium]|nr:enoyl-CoA hydratase/isomerase family protein [Candidatus Brocadiia bacterium]
MGHLLTEDADGVRRITINRPDKLNALNSAVVAELEAAFVAAAGDPAVRAIVLTGSGEKAFVAGADIAEMSGLSPLEGAEFGRRGQRAFDRIENCGKPVIAAINGFALGGGCELALACHIRFASPNAKIGEPEVTLGLIPGWGGSQRFPRIVGQGRALEWILSGGMMDAAEAHRIGLVNRVVEQPKLVEEATAFAKKIASLAPVAVRFALECVLASSAMGIDDGQRLEATKFGLAFSTDDMKEGTKAFVEKRKPAYRGR